MEYIPRVQEDIMSWLNVTSEALNKIQSVLPSWVKDEPLHVLRSGFPPLDTVFASDAWIRPATMEDYQDNAIYREPVPASGRTRTIPGNNLQDFMAAHGYSWSPLGNGSKESSLGLHRYINSTASAGCRLTAEYEHNIHIQHGAFVVR